MQTGRCKAYCGLGERGWMESLGHTIEQGASQRRGERRAKSQRKVRVSSKENRAVELSASVPHHRRTILAHAL